MRGKKLVMLAMAIALLVAIPAVVFAAGSMKAKSHAKPPTKISAKFKFVDDGTTLTITGTAKGMDSGHPYSSLIYDPGSSVKGVDACEPSDLSLIVPVNRMVVGDWAVAEDGTGALGPEVLGPGPLYVALGDIGTISVRAGIPAGPGSIPVVACGAVD